MIALLLALSAEPDLEAISRAAQRHDACVEASVAKFITAKEPADVIASVALWECSGRWSELFEAQVAFQQASSPTSDPQAIRRLLVADLPRDEAQRRERAIYYVVTQRMGISWHMPDEPYNSRQ